MIIKENYSLNNYGAIKFYQKFQDLNLIEGVNIDYGNIDFEKVNFESVRSTRS